MGTAKRKGHRQAASGPEKEPVVGLRIIGGSMRGRKIDYSGDLRTRPMKDRVRQAVFDLLGPVKGHHAIDLFAGTGALGLEALSRGASRATFIERHLPTSKVIERNITALGVEGAAKVVFGDAFSWSQLFQPDTATPLTVFCSPPYDFYVDRDENMLRLIQRWADIAPPGSQIVVEADERFDMTRLPAADQWDVRQYLPAVVAVLRQ
jgi:16S rRNA (guanine(966)-N(2))-methyltransferase RsmD